jgi:hypothetical protein
VRVSACKRHRVGVSFSWRASSTNLSARPKKYSDVGIDLGGCAAFSLSKREENESIAARRAFSCFDEDIAKIFVRKKGSRNSEKEVILSKYRSILDASQFILVLPFREHIQSIQGFRANI